MVKKSQQLIVYGDDFYRFKILLENPEVKKRILRLKQRLKDFNCSIPKDGFKTLKKYNEWNENYKEKIREAINKNNTDFPYVSRELKKILNIHRFDKTKYLLPLRLSFYFGVNQFPRPYFSVTFKKNKETKDDELWLRIFSYTKPRDIKKRWNMVESYQKMLPDYKKRNKPKSEIDRHLQVYFIHQELKQMLKHERKEICGEFNLIDTTIEEAKKQGIHTSDSNVRKINAFINKLLSEKSDI